MRDLSIEVRIYLGEELYYHRELPEALEQAFGDHYVNIDAQVHTGSVTSAETRKAVAQAIYDKMKDLGYIA